MYNATSTEDENGDLETYENWLERQLISRIERLEQLRQYNVVERAEDLLDKIAQEEGFGNWETVVLNCHHSVIISVAIAAVRQALRQPPVSGRVCFFSDCFYHDKTTDTCVGDYANCTVKQTHH